MMSDATSFCVMVGDRRIRALGGPVGVVVYMLPSATRQVRLVASEAGDRGPASRSDRRGFPVGGLTVRSGDEVEAIPLDHPMLRDGWCGVERAGNRMRRWTDGDAILPLPALGAGPLVLEVEIADSADFPVEMTGATTNPRHVSIRPF
jgi:hypothetical protein